MQPNPKMKKLVKTIVTNKSSFVSKHAEVIRVITGKDR